MEIIYSQKNDHRWSVANNYNDKVHLLNGRNVYYDEYIMTII